MEQTRKTRDAISSMSTKELLGSLLHTGRPLLFALLLDRESLTGYHRCPLHACRHGRLHGSLYCYCCTFRLQNVLKLLILGKYVTPFVPCSPSLTFARNTGAYPFKCFTLGQVLGSWTEKSRQEQTVQLICRQRQ
jgi:hypothetical protein